eukprot:1141535-Pelagomonas_calceolata.AAC.5
MYLDLNQACPAGAAALLACGRALITLLQPLHHRQDLIPISGKEEGNTHHPHSSLDRVWKGGGKHPSPTLIIRQGLVTLHYSRQDLISHPDTRAKSQHFV